MNLIKIILRGLLSLLTVLLLIYLHIKTDENVERIATFKFETLDNVKNKSLDFERKFDFMENETARFSGMILEDTVHTRTGVTYLSFIIGLLITIEIGFLVLEKRRLLKITTPE